MNRWRAVPFSWLGEPEMAARAATIRMRVFVDEQKVPAHEELDAIDPVAWHVLVLGEDDEAVATGRLFTHAEGTGRIGRMAVLAPARSTGAGRAVMDALLAEARARGYRRVILDAQTHAIPFYAKFGFVVDGPEHLDCNIPHKMMKRELE